MPHASSSSKIKNSKTELTVLEAVKLANSSALLWNLNAQLLDITNIDLDTQENSIPPLGNNGKRKHWNVRFAVPDTNKLFLVTIHDGKIDQTNDLTMEGVSPYLKQELINLSDINHDSPQLIKKAIKKGGIHPGQDWAKGYNFMLSKDPETNTPLMLVIGWDSDNEKMVAVNFNANNGKLLISK